MEIQIPQSTLDNGEFAVAKNATLNSQFPVRPRPSPNAFFFSECVLGRIFLEVRHFFILTQNPTIKRLNLG